MHEGRWSLILGLRGMPSAAEDVDAIRDCVLAKLTGARVHLAHLSTRGAIEAVRRAREIGLPVTCEVAPHHWSLTDESVSEYDTNNKMSPPLRSADHVAALLEGLRDGTVDAIATDHAPHHADEKALEFDQAPFGITGARDSSRPRVSIWSIRALSILNVWWSCVRQPQRASSGSVTEAPCAPTRWGTSQFLIRNSNGPLMLRVRNPRAGIRLSMAERSKEPRSLQSSRVA